MGLSYFIDGYNAIHQNAELRRLADSDFESARDVLIEWVARFCSASASTAHIVFDGRGEHGTSASPVCGTPGIAIHYSPGKHTADTFIERAVYQASDRREMVVVSADRGLREMCQGLGTLVMKPKNFFSTVRELLDRDREGLGRSHAQHRRYTVEERLDERAIGRLNELREELDKK